jgi:hypothetical protein
MCIMAMVARALKSIVQVILLSSKGEKLNSMNLFLYMTLIPIVVFFTTIMLLEPNVLRITDV